MNPGATLRRARRRARLSQRALAGRTSVAQPTIARIEVGREDPRVGTLQRLLMACGEELNAIAARGEGVDRTQIRELLRLSPRERLDLIGEEYAALSRIRPLRSAPDVV